MTKQQILPYQLALGALALGSVLTQIIFIPFGAAGFAASYPQVAYLETPYVIAFVIAIVGFEVALIAGWFLLTAVGRGTQTVARVKRDANVIAAGLWFMLLVSGGVFAHAGFVENVGGPPVLFGLLFCLALLPAVWFARRRIIGPTTAVTKTEIPQWAGS